MLPCITLLTDFGDRDTYVGQMKGAILTICPEVRLVDLTHQISPGDIAAAALAWADSVSAFPPGSIHLAVIDPGVGSARRALAAEIGPWRFVCPDNGLVTHLLERWPLGKVVELSAPRWWRDTVSAVFHGRDLFGPVAAHWASGVDLSEFGPPLAHPPLTLTTESVVAVGNELRGQIQQIDRFGNLITNIPASLLTPPLPRWNVQLGERTIRGLSEYYGEHPPGEPLALIGSHGRLEIAVNQGHAANQFGVGPGTRVVVIAAKNKTSMD